jgi:hypothetical protein
MTERTVTETESRPSNVIHCTFNKKVTDGGKARIQRHRGMIFASDLIPTHDLVMGSADPEIPLQE